jgi:general secretion pathway protein K
MTRRLRQRGVILLSALVLVALATVLAAALFFDTGMAARRTLGSFGMEQALLLSEGAEGLAAYVLSQDKNQTDTKQDTWTMATGEMEVAPDVVMQAQLFDLQGRFNLNTLVQANGKRDENAYKVFTRLLELLQMERNLADFVVDMIDPDVQPEQLGGEDSLYTSQQPPHRTANLPLISTSELMQVPGFTRELYLKLAPHVTALPPSVRTVNVCMADGFVLDALYAVNPAEQGHSEYSLLSAEEFDKRRETDCFPRRTAIAGSSQPMLAITAERTSWFRLETWVRVGSAQFQLYSLMYRGGNQARAVMRSFGTE